MADPTNILSEKYSGDIRSHYIYQVLAAGLVNTFMN
jgi:hypothetical protein